MRCSKCGSQMRVKDIYMGDDDYGDPIYNEYAFCDNCRIKKNIEGLYRANGNDYDDYDDRYTPAPSKKRSKSPSRKVEKKQGSGCLNTLIAILGVLILLMVAFIALFLNKDKIPFIKDLFPATTPVASVSANFTQTEVVQLHHHGITYDEIINMIS